MDKSSIKSTIEAFAKGYNEVISFITCQSVINGSKGGVLGGDSGINSIKRRLQSMLTQPFANSGVFTTLSQLGFETQKDGTLVVNDKKLSAAVDEQSRQCRQPAGRRREQEGLATQFQDYLKVNDQLRHRDAQRKKRQYQQQYQTDRQPDRLHGNAA